MTRRLHVAMTEESALVRDAGRRTLAQAPQHNARLGKEPRQRIFQCRHIRTDMRSVVLGLERYQAR